MQNVALKVDQKKQILTIEIDLKQRLGQSKSGKTMIIATTEGNQKIGHGDITLGLNLYTKEGINK